MGQWLSSNVQDEHSPHKGFPPPDLLNTLISLYFAHMNDLLPLLHRPTFEQSVREGLHLRDEGFGSTVLLVAVSPLLLATAIAVKVTSRGPVLFRQSRLGTHGTEFGVLKFRSMYAGAEARRDDLLDLGIVDRRFGYPLETVLAAAQAGWRVVEVDVSYRRRTAGGRSKVSGSVRGTLRVLQDFTAVLRRRGGAGRRVRSGLPTGGRA